MMSSNRPQCRRYKKNNNRKFQGQGQGQGQGGYHDENVPPQTFRRDGASGLNAKNEELAPKHGNTGKYQYQWRPGSFAAKMEAKKRQQRQQEQQQQQQQQHQQPQFGGNAQYRQKQWNTNSNKARTGYYDGNNNAWSKKFGNKPRDSNLNSVAHAAPSEYQMNGADHDDQRTIFVGHIPKTVRERDMNVLFGKFGEIDTLHLKGSDHEAYAFIRYRDSASVQRAIMYPEPLHMHGQLLQIKPRYSGVCMEDTLQRDIEPPIIEEPMTNEKVQEMVPLVPAAPAAVLSAAPQPPTTSKVLRVSGVPHGYSAEYLFSAFMAFGKPVATYIYEDRDEHGLREGLVQIDEDAAKNLVHVVKKIQVSNAVLHIHASGMRSISDMALYSSTKDKICTKQPEDTAPQASQGPAYFPAPPPAPAPPMAPIPPPYPYMMPMNMPCMPMYHPHPHFGPPPFPMPLQYQRTQQAPQPQPQQQPQQQPQSPVERPEPAKHAIPIKLPPSRGSKTEVDKTPPAPTPMPSTAPLAPPVLSLDHATAPKHGQGTEKNNERGENDEWTGSITSGSSSDGSFHGDDSVDIITESAKPLTAPPPEFCWTKVFIKHLDPELFTNDDDLSLLFCVYGELDECSLCKWPDGRSREFGFVTFKHGSCAKEAVAALNAKVIGQNQLFVKFAE